MVQIHCPLWVTWEDPVGSRPKLWVSCWLTSVSWWEHKRYGQAHTIYRPMVSVRGSTPLWLVCWECYPQRRSQRGRTTLEHWFVPINVPKIQLQGSAPATWCMGDNPTFQLMLPLAWHHTQQQHQTPWNLCKRWGNVQNGLRKRLKPSTLKRPSVIKRIMTN